MLPPVLPLRPPRICRLRVSRMDGGGEPRYDGTDLPTISHKPNCKEPTMPRKPNRASSLTRRRFLQSAAAAGAVLAGAPAYVSCRAPGEKLNIAIIGCGGRGGANLGEMLGE